MDLLNVLNRNFTDITDKYRKFATEKDACRRCSIYDSYKQVGQSEGNARNPTFMFVGEAPGKDEVEQVRPFIGRAGKRLRAEIRRYPDTFTRKSTLITNLVCCRPANNKFPRDADGPWNIRYRQEGKASHFQCYKAKDVVMNCASSWLFREIQLLKPKVIITLGSQALEYMRQERGITQHRGSWLFLNQFQAWSYATYHPSYVIRCENDENKKYVAAEFEQDIEKIGRTWQQIIDSDPRMTMSHDEFYDHKGTEFFVDNMVIQDKPISNNDPLVQAWKQQL